MKNVFTLIIIPFVLVSCWKDINDTNKNCAFDCTTISGRIVTENGTVPAGGLNFQLDWTVMGELGGTYRNIKKFKTDNNGYFDFNFHASDLELIHRGGYTIKYLDSDENYVDLKDNSYDYPVIGVVDLRIRDTIINKTLWLPKHSSIKIKILNSNIKTYCNVYYKYGEISSNRYRNYRSGGSISSTEQLEKILNAAGNQLNYLQITREINNKLVSTDDSIYVPIRDTITYTIK